MLLKLTCPGGGAASAGGTEEPGDHERRGRHHGQDVVHAPLRLARGIATAAALEAACSGEKRSRQLALGALLELAAGVPPAVS